MFAIITARKKKKGEGETKRTRNKIKYIKRPTKKVKGLHKMAKAREREKSIQLKATYIGHTTDFPSTLQVNAAENL